MASVFISYGREDLAKVRSLADDIDGLGHQAWFDQDLTGGQAWWDRLLKAIREQDVFVFVLSPASLSSKACKLEYTYAAKLGKRILPVIVADGVAVELLPSPLALIEYVDCRKEDKASLKALAKALAGLLPPLPLPSPLPEPPAAPVSYLTSLSDLIDAQRPLSLDEQNSIVHRLKHSSSSVDGSNSELVRTLLNRLRLRHDLYATVGEDIDEVLHRSISAPEGKKSQPSVRTRPAKISKPVAELLASAPQRESPGRSDAQMQGQDGFPILDETRTGIRAPRDFLLAMVFGMVLQVLLMVAWNIYYGVDTYFQFLIQSLIHQPTWALFAWTFLVSMGVWRMVRTNPPFIRFACMVWPIGGAFLIVVFLTMAEVLNG